MPTETPKPQPVAPRDAATVILLRDGAAGLEVFLMRRDKAQKFMGDAYVYPGGRVDEADLDPRLASHATAAAPGDPAGLLREPGLSPERALGLIFAAVRETFEESGVLLAAGPDGRPAGQNGRFADYRRRVHDRETTLADMAEQEGLTFRLDQLVPFAHWITPEIESRRFDTRFFLARVPEGQAPDHDRVELSDSVWLTPAEALARQAAGRIILMPPTLKTLTELCAHDSAEAAFQAARGCTIRPIMPQAYVAGKRIALLLTHDPLYRLEYKQEPRPEEPSRLVLENRAWSLHCAADCPLDGIDPGPAR